MLGVTKNDLWRLAHACCEAPQSENRLFEGKLREVIATFEKNRWSREIFKFVERWWYRIGNEQLLDEALDAFERLECHGVGSSEVYLLMVLVRPKEAVEKRAEKAMKDWHKNPEFAEASLRLMKEEKTDGFRLSLEARTDLARRLERIESGMRSRKRKDADSGSDSSLVDDTQRPQTNFGRRTGQRTETTDPQPKRRRKQTR